MKPPFEPDTRPQLIEPVRRELSRGAACQPAPNIRPATETPDLTRQEYAPDGRLKWQLLEEPGEKVLIRYDKNGRIDSEDLTISEVGQAEYVSHTKYEYSESGCLLKRWSKNSLGETRCAEFDDRGNVVVEKVVLTRNGQADYSSKTRFEYQDNGHMKLRLFEDCLGERRRTEYDKRGRKLIEDRRVPGQFGYAARTQYAYETDEVHFARSPAKKANSPDGLIVH